MVIILILMYCPSFYTILGEDDAVRGPGARVHQGGDPQVHGAQAGLLQGLPRLPQVCQCSGESS